MNDDVEAVAVADAEADVEEAEVDIEEVEVDVEEAEVAGVGVEGVEVVEVVEVYEAGARAGEEGACAADGACVAVIPHTRTGSPWYEGGTTPEFPAVLKKKLSSPRLKHPCGKSML